MICYTNKYKIPFQIDEEDYESVSHYFWYIQKGYVATNLPIAYGERTIRRSTSLHIFLMGRAPEGLEWDHINLDKMDCRRENLRAGTHLANMWNLPLRSDNTSGYPGVSKIVQGDYIGQYIVDLIRNRKCIRVGIFKTFEEAVVARIEAEKDYLESQK